MGQNPAVGGQNASFQRQALAKLDWLVVRDLYETETASFWKDSPGGARTASCRPQDIETEVFFLPAAAVPEMDGSFTNTQRLVQWHDKAVDPPGRRPLRHLVHRSPRAAAEGAVHATASCRATGRIQALVWDYIDPEANERVADQGRAVGAS